MFDSQVHIYDERADYCPSNLGWETLAGIDIESYGRDVDCEIFHDWTVQDFDGSYVHNVGVASVNLGMHSQYDIILSRIYFGLFGSGKPEKMIVLCEDDRSAQKWFKDCHQRIRSRPFFRDNIKKVRKMDRSILTVNGSSVRFVGKRGRNQVLFEREYAYHDTVIVVDAHTLSLYTDQFFRLRLMTSSPRTNLLMIGDRSLAKKIDPIGIIDRFGSEIEGLSWIEE